MVSRLECTRVHFIQTRSRSRDLKAQVSVLVSRPKKRSWQQHWAYDSRTVMWCLSYAARRFPDPLINRWHEDMHTSCIIWCPYVVVSSFSNLTFSFFAFPASSWTFPFRVQSADLQTGSNYLNPSANPSPRTPLRRSTCCDVTGDVVSETLSPRNTIITAFSWQLAFTDVVPIN